MKIAFFSNFFNHHQLEISKEFIKQGVNYTFIATEPIPRERIDLGYEDMNKKYSFILTTYDSEENYNKALKLAIESDVVIIGSAPEIFIKERIEQNKIIYRYSERIFKKGRYKVLNPRLIVSLWLNHTRYNKKNIFMLCSSAYTAKDYGMVGAYKDKCYKWGYFPKNIDYNLDELLLQKKKNKKIKIIWIGRFIEWKHPEFAIELAKHLKCFEYEFEIVMIGNGKLLNKVKKIVNEQELENYIKILGAVPSKEVRKYMEEANIHIFTSDQNEGWGAVLNESMNSGCAVVANKKIGSVPYLIQDGYNGDVYKDKKEFFNKVIKLIVDEKRREEISKNAYNTIKNVWNPENAVKNFLKICKSKISGKEQNIEKGPCSKDRELL